MDKLGFLFVTACSRALEFAREGAIVTIASRNEERLARAAAEIKREIGQTALTVQLDVTNPEQILQAVSRRTGGLDVLVTNTGGPPIGSFENFDDEAWLQAFNLT